MANRIPEHERVQIVEYLREKKTHGWIARKMGRSKPTVGRIAKAEGIISTVTAAEKATAARLDYDQAARLELINEGFDKSRELLAGITDAGAFQRWTVGVGTLVDKRRLEDGEATSRSENVDAEARARVRGKLDELAARRSGANRTS